MQSNAEVRKSTKTMQIVFAVICAATIIVGIVSFVSEDSKPAPPAGAHQVESPFN